MPYSVITALKACSTEMVKVCNHVQQVHAAKQHIEVCFHVTNRHVIGGKKNK